jgi:hypothetical protein
MSLIEEVNREVQEAEELEIAQIRARADATRREKAYELLARKQADIDNMQTEYEAMPSRLESMRALLEEDRVAVASRFEAETVEAEAQG